jgi:hypothetical protein
MGVVASRIAKVKAAFFFWASSAQERKQKQKASKHLLIGGCFAVAPQTINPEITRGSLIVFRHFLLTWTGC